MTDQYTMFDKDVFDRFVKPETGEIIEIRGLNAYGRSDLWSGWAKGTVHGYFDNQKDFCRCVRGLDKIESVSAYMTLQVVRPDLLARANNRLKVTERGTTSDKDILAYRWLPVDLDPIRPSGISSTDGELECAMKLREKIAAYCVHELGFSPPVKAMSGNGAHLLFPLENLQAQNETVQSYIKSVLERLAKTFSNDRVDVDTSVYNPSRIWKIYGTTARKGDSLAASGNREARPHRRSYIDALGDC